MFSTGEVLLDCASVEETSLLRGECELGREMGIDVGEQRNKMEGTQCPERLYGTQQPAGLPLNPYVKKKLLGP